MEYNHAGHGGAIRCNNSACPTISNCTFSNNSATYGAAINWVNQSNPTISNCTITNNTASSGGGLYTWGCEGSVSDCTISGNTTTSTYARGGGVYSGNAKVNLTDCKITGNSAVEGGGVYTSYGYGYPGFTMRNCLVAGNSATEGGGFYGHYSSRTLVNCTIADNTADYGGGLYLYSSDNVIDNGIIWGNTASASGNQIYTEEAGSEPVLNYSDYANGTGDIEGLGTVTENDCIHVDPLFVDSGASDYHLQDTSPCVDTGSNSLVPSEITEDLDGNSRIIDGDNDQTATVDMGPYELEFVGPITIYVDGVNGDDNNNGLSWENAVRTIQKGLDLADSGDTVLVADTTYAGVGNKDLDFSGKAIHLKAEDHYGSSIWIIDCESSGRGFVFESGETNAAVVDGFTITNGDVGSGYGGGIYCRYGSSPTIQNCIIDNNHADHGGGIYCYDSSPVIIDCTVSNNDGTWGGGIYCDENSYPTITNCTVSNLSLIHI